MKHQLEITLSSGDQLQTEITYEGNIIDWLLDRFDQKPHWEVIGDVVLYTQVVSAIQATRLDHLEAA